MSTVTEVRVCRKVSLERRPGELATPLKAIRAHCLGCGGESRKEVALCTITYCPLWPYRFGSRKRAARIVEQERERKETLPERYWAESLTDSTEQPVHKAEAESLSGVRK